MFTISGSRFPHLQVRVIDVCGSKMRIKNCFLMLYLELPVRLVILFGFIQFNSVYFILIQINRHGLSPFNMPGTSSVSCFRKRQKNVWFLLYGTHSWTKGNEQIVCFWSPGGIYWALGQRRLPGAEVWTWGWVEVRYSRKGKGLAVGWNMA